jgi:subtilisin family serine protease
MHDGSGRWRRGAAAGTLAILVGALAAPGGAAAADRTLAPLLSATGPAVPGSYIVVLDGKPGTATAARTGSAVSRATALGAKVERRYHSALNGFSARLTPGQVSALRADPDVAYISPNHRFGLDIRQLQAPWGLDRIDQRNRPLDAVYDYNRIGTGVTVYVIDSGIRATHSEFGGRVVAGYDAYYEDEVESTDDCVGHGTHVAATVGSGAYGVAKGVQIVPVKVFGCSPWTSTDVIVSGVDWVTSHHSGHYLPAVANMSLGGPPDYVMDYVVSNSIATGVMYVVSAGNYAIDACDQSPARVPEAITVGASDASDARAYFSNYGTCVDLFAPGVDVLSASNGSDWDSRLGTGTSMASPHVAGTVAMRIQENYYHSGTAGEVAQWLTDNATPGVLSDVRGSPNLLLHIHGPADGFGMTWVVKHQRADDVVLVGSDSHTDPYHGDYGSMASLPILCLLAINAPVPSGIVPDQYNGWSRAMVQLTPPVLGTRMTSYSEASRICAATFGPGWRMATFHEGWYNGRGGYGWNFWAHGTLPTTTRFWVAIHDRPANVWD